MIVTKRTFLHYALVAYSAFSFSCTTNNPSGIVESQSLGEYGVCSLKDATELRDGEEISVRGHITGYHEMMLYSEKCASQNKEVMLEFSESGLNKLRDIGAAKVNSSPDLKGEIFLHGRYFRNGGKLYTYPARRVDNSNLNDGVLIPNIVDKLVVLEIVKFTPD